MAQTTREETVSMKMGFIGGKKPDRTEAAAKLAKEHGYEGLEFDYWKDFEDLINDEAVAAMKKALAKHGVRVAAYGLWGYNHISLNAEERAHAHKTLDRAIGYAEKLGAHCLVLGTGDIPNEPLGRKVAIFTEVFPPILKRIESAGMQAAFYALHGNTFLVDLPAYERVWEQLPDVKMKYDYANWESSGHDGLEVVRRYGNKMGHVHIKEMIRAGNRIVSQPPAGMGEVPWGKVLTFLHEHKYDGYLSLEPHMRPWVDGEGLVRNLILSRRHIAQFLA
jgi:sugar phosphate isomerase/epimerase